MIDIFVQFSMEIKSKSCCCGFVAFIIGIIIVGVGFYLFNRSSTVVAGDNDFTDEHKSFIERMSLLSLSNSDSGTSWSWGLALIIIVAALGCCYLFYKKIHLPRHRRNRDERVLQQRQQDFIMDLMNRPVPT